MYDIIFKKCKNCDKEFMLEFSRQLYCCDECKKEYNKAKKMSKRQSK